MVVIDRDNKEVIVEILIELPNQVQKGNSSEDNNSRKLSNPIREGISLCVANDPVGLKAAEITHNIGNIENVISITARTNRSATLSLRWNFMDLVRCILRT
jgi:hypothetical protein